MGCLPEMSRHPSAANCVLEKIGFSHSVARNGVLLYIIRVMAHTSTRLHQGSRDR